MNNYTHLLLVLSLVLSCPVFAQKQFHMPEKNKVIVSNGDENIYAYVNKEKSDFTPKLSSTYYWFVGGQIKSTQGGYSGKLLHGTYESFYLDKNLKEKGEFRYGLKKGEWRAWLSSGSLKEISHWKQGEKEGKYILMDEVGRKAKEGRFKNQLFYGKAYQYLPNDSVSITKYSKGVVVKEQEKKIKDKLIYYYKWMFGKKQSEKADSTSVKKKKSKK